jgi:hypothetical protein
MPMRAILALAVAVGFMEGASAGVDETRPPSWMTWGAWLDRDDASGDGDFEGAPDFTLEQKGCAQPTAIQAETLAGVEASAARELVVVTPGLGLACWNHRQGDRQCLDYRVRFGCGTVAWSAWLNRDTPWGRGDFETAADFTTAEKGCEAPVAIEARTLAGVDWTATGEVLHVSPTVGLACTNERQDDGDCLDYRVRFGCAAP